MFLPRCIRPNDGHDQRVECHVRSRENYFFLPPCRTDFDGPCASSSGARRGAASKKHGRREEARMVASKLRVHAGTPKILWDPRGWPKWSAKWSVAILRRSRFFLFSFSVPTDFFDKSPRDFSRWIERMMGRFWTTIDVLSSICLESKTYMI